MSLSISHPGRCCIYPFSSGAPDSVGWCLQARLHGKKVSLNTRITRCGDAACHARYLGTETTAEVRGDSCLSSHTHSWALCLLSGTQGGAARPIRHFHFVCIMNPCNLNTGSDECYYKKKDLDIQALGREMLAQQWYLNQGWKSTERSQEISSSAS